MTNNKVRWASLMAGIAIGILTSLLLEVIALGKTVPTWLVLTQVVSIIPLYFIPSYWLAQARRA